MKNFIKNKYGFLGFLSLLSLTSLQAEGVMGWISLAWLAFVVYFRYFWVVPDEMLIETFKKCASIAFYVQLVGLVVFTLISMVWVTDVSPLDFGARLAFATGFTIFPVLLPILEVIQLRGVSDD